jgi:hypothetical protein
MEIRDFLRLFIKNEQSVINALDAEVTNWMLSVQLIDNFGNTPVHHIAKNGNLSCLKQLVGTTKAAQAKFYRHYQITNKDGLTPLDIAIIEKQIAIIEFFMQTDENKVFLNTKSSISLIELLVALDAGEIAKLLFHYVSPEKVITNYRENMPFSPFITASILKKYLIARELISCNKNVINEKEESTGANAFMLSLQGEVDWQWLQYLLENNISLYERNKKNLAIVDAYFAPNLFYIGWVKGGKTHKNFRNLLWPYIKLRKAYLHRINTLILLFIDGIKIKAVNIFKKMILDSIAYSIISIFPFLNKNKKNELIYKPSIHTQAEIFLKKINNLFQETKQYNNSVNALAEDNASKGNLIYGAMTEKILASRGYVVQQHRSAAENEDSYHLEQPEIIAPEQLNSDIPDDLLPDIYKQNKKSEDNIT